MSTVTILNFRSSFKFYSFLISRTHRLALKKNCLTFCILKAMLILSQGNIEFNQTLELGKHVSTLWPSTDIQFWNGPTRCLRSRPHLRSAISRTSLQKKFSVILLSFLCSLFPYCFQNAAVLYLPLVFFSLFHSPPHIPSLIYPINLISSLTSSSSILSHALSSPSAIPFLNVCPIPAIQKTRLKGALKQSKLARQGIRSSINPIYRTACLKVKCHCLQVVMFILV